MSDFKSLKLHPSIQDAISKKGYTTPTPIQKQAIPHLLQGRDLLGIAQTGTGKTAAFALPILQHLSQNRVKTKTYRVRALVLTPTRELAAQIETSFKEYGAGLKLYSSVIFGGVSHRPQVKTLSKGVDTLVATPGRLLDLMSEGYVRFSQLEVFVLDEADRMLDMGFFRDVRKIIAKLPQKRQTLLFSATMPNDIAKLARTLLEDPVRVEVTPQATTVEKIEQKVNMLDSTNKPLLLRSILQDDSVKRVLVFTRTKHGADRVVKQLDKASIHAVAIHGNKSQGARERALSSFKSGDVRIMVATDIAARGIDVSNISHVINYNLPEEPESYVHRIGRTARAGAEGIAISFCDEGEIKLLRSIERFIRYRLPIDETHAYHGAPPRVKKTPSQPRGARRTPAKNYGQDRSRRRRFKK